jgi:hypothetical protein
MKIPEYKKKEKMMINHSLENLLTGSKIKGQILNSYIKISKV